MARGRGRGAPKAAGSSFGAYACSSVHSSILASSSPSVRTRLSRSGCGEALTAARTEVTEAACGAAFSTSIANYGRAAVVSEKIGVVF